jgi:signal transduction histidine kinase
MRLPVLLAAKISVVFLIVMTTFVFAILSLFVEMVMHPRTHELAREAHDRYVVVVLLLMLVAMALMVGYVVVVTAPLRRMSESMDRIAAGELAHRVRVRGRDEGARIGRSFNAMADRVRAMVVGQKELMASVSHELRSPLARMKVGLELLREGQGGPDRIADLESEVDAIDALVGELLLASRLDLQTVPLQPVELAVAELAREAWERVAAEASRRGATLELRLDPGGERVVADRSLAVRTLGNLFENAVRHAGGGRITLSGERRGRRVEIRVADEGPGVAPPDLARLFEPFFRADRSRSPAGGTGGLGLMIVERAVAAHGGTARASLADPHGLVVTFDLPAPEGSRLL